MVRLDTLPMRSWFKWNNSTYRRTMAYNDKVELCKEFDPTKQYKAIEIFFEGYVSVTVDAMVEPCAHPTDEQ